MSWFFGVLLAYWHYNDIGQSTLPSATVVEYLGGSVGVNTPKVDVLDYMFDPPGDPSLTNGYNKNCTIGGEVYFAHKLVNRSSRPASVSGITLVFNVLTAGYSVSANYDVYYDMDEDGIPDPSEPPVSNTSIVNSGDYFPLVISFKVNSVTPSPVGPVDCELILKATQIEAGTTALLHERSVVEHITIWETERPFVVSVTPSPDSMGIAVTPSYAPITVTFSEPMDSSTIDVNSFYLLDLDRKTKVEGIVVPLDPGYTKFQFFPSEKLHGLTNYMGVVTQDAKDVSGNPLKEMFHWKFKTLLRHDEGGTVAFVNQNGESKVEVAPYAVPEDCNIVVEEVQVALPHRAVSSTALLVKAFNVKGDILCDTNGDGIQDVDFPKDVVVKIAYLDNDQDGFVDNTVIREERLCVNFRPQNAAEWSALKGEGCDVVNNTVIARTKKFGYFCVVYSLSSEVVLHQSFPNPFVLGQQKVIIPFEVPPGVKSVRVDIYTIDGQLIRKLDDPSNEVFLEEGYAVWDGRNEQGKLVGSGVFVYVLHCDGQTRIKRLSAVK